MTVCMEFLLFPGSFISCLQISDSSFSPTDEVASQKKLDSLCRTSSVIIPDTPVLGTKGFSFYSKILEVYQLFGKTILKENILIIFFSWIAYLATKNFFLIKIIPLKS